MIKDFSYLESLGEGEYRFDIWIPLDSYIVLGRSKQETEDINLEYAKMDKIPIIRRITGGGTVLIDEGCIIIDIGFRAKNRNKTIDLLLQANTFLVEKFQSIGIPAEIDPKWPDIKVGNYKICGSCLGIRNTLFIYSASILYRSSTIEKIEYYLKLPQRSPDYRQLRGHKDFLTSIDQVSSISQAEIVAVLKRDIKDAFQGH